MIFSANTASSNVITNQSLQLSSNRNNSFDENEFKVCLKMSSAIPKPTNEKLGHCVTTNSNTVADTSVISSSTQKKETNESLTKGHRELEREKFLYSYLETGLTHRDIQIIRESLMAQGKLTRTKESYLHWINYNLSSLSESLPTAGTHLDHVIGKEYIYIRDAIKAIEQLITRGIIFSEEVANCRDVHTITKAEPYDCLTVHSLSNIIRKIVADRLVNTNF